MDEDDDGTFHYDTNRPPLFVQGAPKLQDSQLTLQTVEFAKRCTSRGGCDPEVVLENGMTAAEAATTFVRMYYEVPDILQHDEHTSPETIVDVGEVLDLMRKALEIYASVDASKYADRFDTHTKNLVDFIRRYRAHLVGQKKNSSNLRDLKKMVSSAMKQFITSIGRKPPGYRNRQNNMVDYVMSRLNCGQEETAVGGGKSKKPST